MSVIVRSLADLPTVADSHLPDLLISPGLLEALASGQLGPTRGSRSRYTWRPRSFPACHRYHRSPGLPAPLSILPRRLPRLPSLAPAFPASPPPPAPRRRGCPG